MFSKKDYGFFILAAILVTAAYILMVIDPVENGFGISTLWIAPPVLLAGFLLPVFGLIGWEYLGGFPFAQLKKRKWKHLSGLLAFGIAFGTYIITLEPTASLWDCSEFIAAAYKLQVPHTPGTPLSLLIGRVFSMAAFGDVLSVAFSINLMSGLFSALTIWIVYYIIFYLGEKVSDREKGDSILIIASLCGSLCLTFSDTFWFSAVEAETYGPACFFLMLLVWLILTGQELQDPLKSRRLILIFYLAGLGYCIHPMCLLALPVLPFIWYTSQRKLTLINTVLPVAAGLALVLVINRFVAVGLFELAFSFDLFFVNQLHFPLYGGLVVLVVLMVLTFIIALRKLKNHLPATWSLVFLLLGFSPYLMLFIRSGHNPPIDETNPENLSMIKAYMNRESYPSSPLLYGPYFDAAIEAVGVKKKIYFENAGRYDVAGNMPEYLYGERQTMLPRMYSNEAIHIQNYRSWTGLKPSEKPRFTDNLKFLFGYQLGHMYMRYLMFNFAGRESDVQDSNWLKPWERLSRSPFEKARNQYWMIPLLLGVAGASFQFQKDKKSFYAVAIFFLITGIVLALYLNVTPNQPRERDYIFVGSYIAFTLWIGLAPLWFRELFSRTRFATIIAGMIGLLLPLWMLYQNFDDHNRSGRTFQVDNARNILRSCAPQSILFTGGDNDTFPMWYLQEVEGFRTDVRVMVLSYMNTDWYINQLRKPYYDSPAFQLTLGKKDYRQYGPNDVLYVQESIKKEIDVKQYFELLKADHPALSQIAQNGEKYRILPSRMLRVKTVMENVLKVKGGNAEEDSAEMVVKITENYVPKNLLAILDVMVSNGWKRPIYFNFTSLNSIGTNLNSYVVQEGPVYRLIPAKKAGDDIYLDPEIAYRNMIVNADYSNLKNRKVNFSYEDYYQRIIVPIRQSFNALAVSFYNEGKHEMAEKVLLEAREKLYPENLPPSYTNLQAADILHKLNNDDQARWFAAAAFGYYDHLAKTNLEDHKKIDDLDLYIRDQSLELLKKIGK